MTPLIAVVAVFASLSAAGGSPLPLSKAVVGEAERGGLRVRKLQPVVYCSSLQCPERSTPIADASTTECDDGTCVASVCCEARCSFQQCPDRSTPVVDADDIVCDDLTCTDELCCEARCSFQQCPSGETLVEDADNVICPDLVCPDGLCCE